MARDLYKHSIRLLKDKGIRVTRVGSRTKVRTSDYAPHISYRVPSNTDPQSQNQDNSDLYRIGIKVNILRCRVLCPLYAPTALFNFEDHLTGAGEKQLTGVRNIFKKKSKKLYSL